MVRLTGGPMYLEQAMLTRRAPMAFRAWVGPMLSISRLETDFRQARPYAISTWLCGQVSCVALEPALSGHTRQSASSAASPTGNPVQRSSRYVSHHCPR